MNKEGNVECRMGYLFLIAGIFFGDLRIKNYVEKSFPEEGEWKKKDGLLRLRKHYNRGAFLNAGQENRRAVAALSVCLTFFVLALFVASLGTKGNRALRTGLAMLLGGAFSNTYDRCRRKYVVDYFSFGVKCKGLSRIVFNISDFGIILGALTAALAAGNGGK